MKVYQAGSVLSISINLPDGKPRHIRFDSLSNGKSTYRTDDEGIQYGIEHSFHYREGGIEIVFDDAPSAKPKAKEIVVEQNPEAEYKEVKVASWDDAKNYLVENLGIASSKIRTQSAISKFADANNIHFIF